MQIHKLREGLDTIPHEPGCYFFKKGKNDKILYIGKAKDLKKRVSQYFLENRDQKTQAMLAEAQHIDWIATRTEVEALLLEARLIREHKPQFNIDLKDNTGYAFIKITNEPFPRLITAREQDAKQTDLIGPFTDGSARIELMTLTRKLFRLRVCKTMPKRVCLYYHIGQCSGPCEEKITKEAYVQDVDRARLFMKGKAPELVQELETAMQRASKELKFEQAQHLRDTIRAVQYSTNRHIIAREKRYNEDVLVMRPVTDQCFFLVLHVIKGMIAQAEEFSIDRNRVDAQAPLDDFLKTYYQDHAIPDEILLEHELKDPAITEYLQASKKVTVVIPHHGPKLALLEVARKNIMARMNKAHYVLTAVQDALRLPQLPRRIDAFDNSHLQGTNTVSACIQFLDGKPNKQAYRKFIIKTVGNDDVASMKEAVSRRYAKVLQQQEPLPDLILIDGGKAQLHAAYAVLQELGLHIPVIGLAKREEEVFVPGLRESLPVDKKSEASLFLQQVRNEIHRFVITFHRQKRKKAQVRSLLDDVPGIGEITKFKLLQEFGSLEGIKKASDADLAQLLTKRQQENLKTFLESN